jgi:hypothetical protein
MRDRRVRAFWMTLLVYALGGPLVGLLSLLVIAFVVAERGPIVDQLGALMPHAPDPACVAPDPGHLDLRCFQRLGPRQFGSVGWPDAGKLSALVFGAYVIGFIPALVAGLAIVAGAFDRGGVGLIYALVVGTLVGLVTGAMTVFYPEIALLLFFICLIATVVCWLLTRPWWRKAKIADDSAAG